MFTPSSLRRLIGFMVCGTFFAWIGTHLMLHGSPQKMYSGTIVPKFSLLKRTGKWQTSQHFRGKWLLLNFWATWCEPCRREMPSLERLSRKMPHLNVIAASVDEDWSTIDTFLSKHPLLSEKIRRMNVVRDPERRSSSQFGTLKFPETYLIDPSGIYKKKFIGFFEWDSKEKIRQLNLFMKPTSQKHSSIEKNVFSTPKAVVSTFSSIK